MERPAILVIALAGAGGLWLIWWGIKSGLRRSIRVEREILSDDYPTLLYFHSVDCAPCRHQQGPIVASLEQDLGDCVKCGYLVCDKHSDLRSGLDNQDPNRHVQDKDLENHG